METIKASDKINPADVVCAGCGKLKKHWEVNTEHTCSDCLQDTTLLRVDALDALEHQIWTCGECLFFGLDRDSARVGSCRRKPPKITGHSPHGLWPGVHVSDWCGESLPNAATLEKMRKESAPGYGGDYPDLMEEIYGKNENEGGDKHKVGCGCSNAINTGNPDTNPTGGRIHEINQE